MKSPFAAAPVAALLLAVPLLATGARAQLLVSANDGKAVLVNGVSTVPADPVPDHVTIVDLGQSPPKVVGEVPAPASVVGPPQSVAVAPDESIALVTGATRIDPNNPKKVAPDDKLTVIDLKASPPKVLATLEAGKGASGVSINRTGTLALVANRAEGTVSVFSIKDKALTPAGKIDFGNAKSGPSHAVFTPDGKAALVTRDGDHKISLLSVDGDKVTYTKRDMVGGIRPYAIEVGPKGDVAIVGNQGGGQGDADTINVIDLAAKPPRIVDTISVGQTVEGVSISHDGAHVSLTVMNGSNRPKESPFFNDHGLVKVFAVSGTKLTPVTEAKVGHWCQGAAWSRDGRTLVVECMVEQELMLFRFDGHSLTPAAPIKLKAGPAGLRTAEP
ncbi:MAG TPA: YncE family protein [Xanthobacteraceae bacterium]|nr:YncE family protein [Xanthobacteraceae bacterium]